VTLTCKAASLLSHRIRVDLGRHPIPAAPGGADRHRAEEEFAAVPAVPPDRPRLHGSPGADQRPETREHPGEVTSAESPCQFVRRRPSGMMTQRAPGSSAGYSGAPPDRAHSVLAM
jgi:hypothetical protein